jgi:hypothetical protein
VSARGFARLKIFVLANSLGGPREPKAHKIQADGARRELLVGNERDLVLAAVFLVADEVEAGFRHYFPGLELFLSHNIFKTAGNDRKLFYRSSRLPLKYSRAAAEGKCGSLDSTSSATAGSVSLGMTSDQG